MIDRTTMMSTLFTAAALATGCEKAPGPSEPAAGNAPLAMLSSGVHVLNTQLRVVLAPDIVPTAAWGHAQVRLTYLGEEGYRVEWRARLFNPEQDIFDRAVVYHVEDQPDEPPDLPDAVVSFHHGETEEGCDILDFATDVVAHADPLPASIAETLISYPERHELVFTTTDGSLVAGRFALPDPRQVLGFNPQPDPPGLITRCDVPPNAIILDPPEGAG